MKLAGYRYLYSSVPTRNQGQYQLEWLVELFDTRPSLKKKPRVIKVLLIEFAVNSFDSIYSKIYLHPNAHWLLLTTPYV